VERPLVASAADLALRLARLLERDVRRDRRERVVAVGVLVDAIEIRLGQLDGRDPPRFDVRGELGDGTVEDFLADHEVLPRRAFIGRKAIAGGLPAGSL
jgi:hypothetical protein